MCDLQGLELVDDLGGVVLPIGAVDSDLDHAGSTALGLGHLLEGRLEQGACTQHCGEGEDGETDTDQREHDAVLVHTQLAVGLDD